MKYYLLENEKRIGPFEINELIEKGIEHETLVWGEGMEEWANAENVEEINSKLPPKLPKSSKIDNSKEQSKTYNVLRYAVLIIIVLFLTGIAIQYFENQSSSYNRYGGENDSPSYEERVQSVEELEKEAPLSYLSTTGNYRKNLLGTKYKVNLNIVNTATIASYKDITIRFSFRSKTDTELSSIQKTFYEVAKAGSSKSFKVKLDIPYKEVSKLDWEITNATPKN